jgi:hypothetical protein
MPAILRALGLCLGLALTSCAPISEQVPIQPVSSRRAALEWKAGSSTTIFEAVFARSAEGAGALDLYKGSPSPVLSLRLSPKGFASMHGSAAKRSWQGDRAEAPPEISLLLAALSLYMNEKALPSGAREMHTGNLRAVFSKSETALTGASFRSIDAPAVITVQFVPSR